MDNIIREIEVEIKKREEELSFLRDNLAGFKKIDNNGHQHLTLAASAETASFKWQEVGTAVRQYMENRKSPATLREIREALEAGGVKWGKYPKRQVKLAVVTSPSVYNLKDSRTSDDEDAIASLK